MIAWIDCSAGIAGDMLLGALLDAGASLEAVRSAVRAVDDRLDVTVERTQRHQLDCAKATVVDTSTGAAADAPAHSHDLRASAPHSHDLRASAPHSHDLRASAPHSHDLRASAPHSHDLRASASESRSHHRSYREVRALLDAADLAPRVRAHAHATFAALARAEGAVHGVDPDDVHFHEVGALDAIGDVVGCAAAFVDLGLEPDAVTASTVTVGHGEQAFGEHGRIPIPGPAVTHLARAARMPITGGPVAMEMTTPTGAALLAAWATAYAPLPPMVIDRVGLGAGTRDPQGVANLVRVVLGEPTKTTHTPTTPVEPAVILEANVDDLDPRLWPEALDALLAAGAHDAWLTPILMKKGRPAHTLAVLCAPEDSARLVAVIARHTTTLGVRERPVTKHVLDRRTDRVDVDGHTIDVKVGLIAGEPVNAQPEFDHCAAAARALGLTAKEVVARASAAWWSKKTGDAAS
ncbi:nickel pincer cofactor biosynthesis protein LarC [Mariniluteicoccus flavus]